MQTSTNNNFTVKQGDDFKKSFYLYNADDSIYSTDNSRFVFGARYAVKDLHLTLFKECEILETGVIQLRLSKAETAELKATNLIDEANIMYYDIQQIKDGEATRIISGEIYVSVGHAYLGGE